jgi:hypothetical protein
MRDRRAKAEFPCLQTQFPRGINQFFLQHHDVDANNMPVVISSPENGSR